MHPDLRPIEAEMRSAQERLHALHAGISPAQWTARPGPGRWSPAQCVEHLNITGRAYLPILEDAVARARAEAGKVPARYRRDLTGWLLWRMMAPPVRMKVKAPPAFDVEPTVGPEALVAEFDRLQEAQLQYLRAADGTPLDRVKVVSPFAAGMRYNLYSCLSLISRHQHRHLWQAEQAVAATTGPG